VDISPGAPQPAGGASALAVSSDCGDPISCDPCTAQVSDTTNGAGAQGLPPRPIPDRQLVRKIRSMDDPEILQRVLAGLLNLL
jgi:hypothetical protein